MCARSCSCCRKYRFKEITKAAAKGTASDLVHALMPHVIRGLDTGKGIGVTEDRYALLVLEFKAIVKILRKYDATIGHKLRAVK